MKKFTAIISCLLLITILAGCSGKMSADNNMPQEETGEYEYDYEYDYTDRVNVGVTNTADNRAAENEDGGSNIQKDRKIIKNAEIDCSAESIQERYQTILAWVKQNSGYEFSQNMTTQGDYYRIDAVFKIIPEKLDAFIEVVRKNTEIINLNISSTDITDDYDDVQTRLKSKKAALEQYYAMLKKAETVDEILKIQGVIDSIILEIESMEGRLILWNSQIKEATVNLCLSETNDPLKPKKQVSFNSMSFGDMFTFMGNGFTSVINVLLGFLQWGFIIIASASPLIVIAGAVIVIIRFIIKRNRKKKGKV